MTYQEERLARLKRQSGEQAIALAVRGHWQEAVVANKLIIENFPRDAEAHNRLGRAYMELGELTRSREAYQRTMELDPFNAIAKKNLQRLDYLGEEKAVGDEGGTRKVEPQQFIEEIGKAGVVDLYHPAPTELWARMVAGDEVYLKIAGTRLTVEDSRGEYLGQVDPKHEQRLVRLMEGGNKYSAAVVSSAGETMTVIIREMYQDPSQARRLSFPPKETEEAKPYVGERVFKLESEHEEIMPEGFGYTIVDRGGVVVTPEEPSGISDDIVSEEE